MVKWRKNKLNNNPKPTKIIRSIATQQNEEENVVKEELQFANDATQFHTFKKVKYIMPKIPKTKEQPARYMTPSTRIMAP